MKSSKGNVKSNNKFLYIIAVSIGFVLLHLVYFQEYFSIASPTKSAKFAFKNVPASVPLPNIILTVRVTSHISKLLKLFLQSYDVFWPTKSAWPEASLALIWDSNIKDRQAALLFHQHINLFEKLPPSGTLCGKMRSQGYSWQQYSNFVQDRLFENEIPEFLGYVDSDSFFTAAVHPSELFDYDYEQKSWRPRVIGYNGCCISWASAATKLALGNEHPPAGLFMIVIGFPIIVKTKHLAYVRDFVASNLMGSASDANFDQAFNKLCHTKGGYSQFDIIMNVLWHSPYRNEYSWVIRDASKNHHHLFNGILTDDPEVLACDDFNSDLPKLGVMEHGHQPGIPDRNSPAFREVIGRKIRSAMCLYGDECLMNKTFCESVGEDFKAEERFTDLIIGAEIPAQNFQYSTEMHMERIFDSAFAWPWLDPSCLSSTNV